MRSTGVKLQNSAGTKQPICAMIASRQVWRKHVDLPPMFTLQFLRSRAFKVDCLLDRNIGETMEKLEDTRNSLL